MSKIFTLKKTKRMPGIITWLAYILVRIYCWTLRVHFTDTYGVYTEHKNMPCVLTIWHNRLLFALSLPERAMAEQCTTLISNSRDGEYVTSFAKHFGMKAVRGSSSKGAVHALFALNDVIKEGLSPVLTLDGPRGPMYTVHPGAVLLAQHNNIPIVPVAINSSSYWKLKSWDKMQIPKPFSKIEYIFSEPIHFSPETTREDALEQLKQAMLSITKD